MGATVAATFAIQPGVNDISATEASFLGVFAFAFAAAGLLAWAHRPATRLGPLLTLFAFVEIMSAFQQSLNRLAFTVGYLVAALPAVVLAHIALAYPSGKLPSPFERRGLAAAYVLLPATLAANLLVYDPKLQAAGINNCHPSRLACPRSAIAFLPSRAAFAQIEVATGAVILLVGLGLLALLLRRYVRETPRARRALGPVAAGMLPIFASGVALSVAHFDIGIPSRALFLAYVIATAGFVAIVVAGMLGIGLGRGAVGTLLVQLEHTPTERLRDALARTLRDPTLELRFWLPDSGQFVDAQGVPAALPGPDRERAITMIDGDGQALAACIHDPGLDDDRPLLDAAVAAARLALENARLQAQLSARLLEVQESRARIVTAGDEERRRLERNIHDGAQQRLVSLALSLRIAQRTLGSPAAPVFDSAVSELQAAVAELRELARGLHPALLSEEGLPAALESLADRTPIPVGLELSALERPLTAEIELSAYFVASEAVTNAVKHAHASAITIEARRTNSMLTVTVADDGIGGADPNGSGFRGLADRVAAHGGQLRVEPSLPTGTRVIAELPCAP